MSTEIKKIIIRMGKKDVELTLDEAKELKTLLNDTFGRETKVVERIIERDTYRHWRPYYWPSITVAPSPETTPWTVTSGTSGGFTAGETFSSNDTLVLELNQ